MFDKRKHILRATAVASIILGFVAADRFLAGLIEQTIATSSFRYSRLYSGNASARIVSLGNSRGINSFYVPAVEELTGMSCVSLAYNGSQVVDQWILFQDYVERNGKPEIVFVEATCLSNRSRPSNFRPFWNESNRLAESAQEQMPTVYFATRLAKTHSYNSEMFYRALYFLNYDDRTSINRYQILPMVLQEEAINLETVELELPDRSNTAAFRELLAFAWKHKIEIRIYVAPYLPQYRDRISNLDEWKDEFGDQTGYEELLDLSLLVSDPGCFADRIHTNHLAAKQIAEALFEQRSWRTPVEIRTLEGGTTPE